MLDITLQETRVYRDAKAEGRQEGRQEERVSLVLLLLKNQLGKISPKLKRRVQALSLEQSEALAIALLNFKTIADLETWLAGRSE
jgi:predicted transposase YdaD